MNKENTQKLYDRFPGLYRQRTLTMQQTLMCWGFECDDGWFDLIWMLSLALEDEEKQVNDKLSLVDQVVERLQGKGPFTIEAVQVKEKYGTLRFYCNATTDRARTLIHYAETLSGQTCELCGKYGKIRNKATWLKTLCNECAVKECYVVAEETEAKSV